MEEKIQVIKKTGILEFIKSDYSIKDIGGLDNLKNWLLKRNNSWSEQAKRYCIPAPKGVLVTGVPGCGKSLTAKAMSTIWQLPLLKLDFGKVFSGLVGSSEENMRRALATAEAVAPSILWIDEIEKGLSGLGSNGDSGVSSRIFGQFLTWMQEKESPVFVIATANNISNLPPELLRKGRFDEIFFVDLPTKQERIDIFKIHLLKRNKDITKFDLNLLAEKTNGYSGAEIEQAIISALYDAFDENREVELNDIIVNIEKSVPLSITMKEKIDWLRNWAKDRAVPASKQETIKDISEDKNRWEELR
jgi:SpoVK/Ycf46/Vps4 family AAA+-type ATPase